MCDLVLFLGYPLLLLKNQSLFVRTLKEYCLWFFKPVLIIMFIQHTTQLTQVRMPVYLMSKNKPALHTIQRFN